MAGTKQIMIQGVTFEVTTPYDEGHVLTAIEAKVLNQTRSENVRNNCAKFVKEHGDSQDASDHVAKYDNEYEFTVAGTGAGRRMDPVEREARSIARDAIRAKLAEDGRKLKDIDPDDLETALEQVAAKDEVIKLAKKRIADKAKLAETAIGDIKIGA